jgi:peptide/nickel transport system permease protein
MENQTSFWQRFLESGFYQNGVSNLIPLAILGLVLFAIARARRQPLWAEAYRRLRRNPLAIGAICVIGLYVGVALLDSVGWQNDIASPRRTLLDRVFDARYRNKQERTYSAPFGRTTFGEPNPRPLIFPGQHPLGTDGTGEDVLYLTLKGCRTALIVGGLTQLIVTPIALLFGMMAGYFGKRVDDAIQYLYSVLDSIPSILLLIALLLVMGRGLVSLCVALGVTSWVGLCRLIRGETLKHRDREYVRAARALGVSDARILMRHILPNLLPIVIISITLGVSGLMLSEATLSYLQVGVEPGQGSWGNMVDAARQELAREPIIWWNITAAATALFILVLAFNVLGDALRDAVDPRLRS